MYRSIVATPQPCGRERMIWFSTRHPEEVQRGFVATGWPITEEWSRDLGVANEP